MTDIKGKNKIERIFLFLALMALLFTLGTNWFVADSDLLKLEGKVLPEAQSFEKIALSPLIYEGKTKDQNGVEEKVGYVVIDQAMGYGGPIKMVIGINLQGKIEGTVIANHKDTPSFIYGIISKKYLEIFIGKSITEPLSINQDIDRITGATYSSGGIAKAISLGCHAVARTQFGLNVTEEAEPFRFGLKEIFVVSLVILMLIGVCFKYSKLRWVTLSVSLVIIGFQYNTPISLANVCSLLMGNFPSVKANLVWYILIIGIPIITFIIGKNVYCFWLCPFGALQEITAKIGGGKFKCPNKSIEAKATQIKYGLAYLALLGAFILKSPSFAGYEPFATLFGRQGVGLQWFMLPVVLFSSLFISRFWCRFFCPVMVMNEVILLIRRSIRKIHREKGDFKGTLVER
ncbi:MAG: 4Fe-4S binding protein [Dehalobacter sp. 4CP]|uniref:4Fe-4S binding protein n=1 Tax=Dehalobacter sp. CP TaxID=2594474 RepID=UPI0013CD5569|nr:4Fe-4S binding protein [Dehalobacter sp. 4CP]